MLLVVLHHRGQGKDHQFGMLLAGVVCDMKNVYIIWLIRGLDKIPLANPVPAALGNSMLLHVRQRLIAVCTLGAFPPAMPRPA